MTSLAEKASDKQHRRYIVSDKYKATGWKYRPNSSLKVKRFFVPKGSNPSEEALDNIALLEEYVAEDDGAFGAPLCTEFHQPGEICRKVRGHDD